MASKAQAFQWITQRLPWEATYIHLILPVFSRLDTIFFRWTHRHIKLSANILQFWVLQTLELLISWKIYI